jgi:hypothetical protein
MNHRWCGHSNGKRTDDGRCWEISRPGPVVLTTRAQWTQELFNALVASRDHNFLKVHFRQDSPNFSATVDLDALADPEAASGFFTVLRE